MILKTLRLGQYLSGPRHVLVLIGLSTMISACGQIYSPEYISRVLTQLDASSDDYTWKAGHLIAPSSRPLPLTRNLQADRVEQALEDSGLDVEAERFLQDSSTTSLLVLQGDELIYEQYFNGANESTLQSMFSVSKSILALVVGSLRDKRLIALDQPVTHYLPELAQRDSRFDNIDLGSLLNMRSGIKYDSRTRFPFINQDAPLVYYATDLREVVLQKTQIQSPPGGFLYNDYNPNLLALALERAMDRNPVNLVENPLFEIVGTEDEAIWSTDENGFPYWESGLVATPRDMAKLGLMMLNNGATQNGRGISDEWHQDVTADVDVELPDILNGRQWVYNLGWWQVLRRNFPNDYAAIGRYGQMIYISPKYSVVFVRTGLDTNPPGDGTLASIFYAAAEVLGGSDAND